VEWVGEKWIRVECNDVKCSGVERKQSRNKKNGGTRSHEKDKWKVSVNRSEEESSRL